jgi:hypothetical protein
MENEFVDFLMSLAPEGETALIVKQSPVMRKGEMMYHADGAIKCTWPAFLPSVKRKAGSWYGNTASFIIDRFQDGKVSASAANCDYVLVMMLDDVGDPDKAPNTPSLAPTWIMETSEGSFQWGYAFSDQPTKGEFSAAITAIAEAGYTDKGACNPVRNFRLPGSVNIKPGRDNFAARLVEFHPEREYALDAICAALGVVPGPIESVHKPIRLSDDGADDVLAWLSGNSLVLTRANSQGWVGVICPNAEQHTDGNPEGRYLPANRAYCCMHGHCMDFGSSAFLEWVADQGGPKHTTGLRDELLTMAMESALNKIRPTAAFPDAAAEVVASVEQKELGRIEKAQWYERFAYIQDDESFFDMQDRRELSRATFNALFRHIACNSIHGTKRRVEASISFDENRQKKGAKTLVGVTYAAGESILVARDGLAYGNRWRNARPQPVAGDVTPWLAHAQRMVPEAFEREHLLNVLAHKVQHPGVKINHAILLGGNHGSGKDTLFAPFFWSIGGAGKVNCALVKNEDLTSQWGYSLECEVMEIAELRQSEAKDRRALENHLKPIIAAPPELLPVNRKGMHPYMALNRVFVVAFSNERVAISLPSEDRRWFVIWADAPKMAESAASALWNWYKAGGFAAVAAWLMARDVSAFNPAAAPPMTEAKAIMVEHGMSMAESFLVSLMRGRLGEFSKGVVGSPFHALGDRLAGAAPQGLKIPQAAILHALKEAGWVDCGRMASRDFVTRKHIFCAPDMVDLSKSELRRLVEDTAAPMRIIK